jgi:hypothetical protein
MASNKIEWKDSALFPFASRGFEIPALIGEGVLSPPHQPRRLHAAIGYVSDVSR